MTIECKAFLDLIAWSEGTSSSPATRCNGYDVIVSGPAGREVFTDFSQHPFEHRAPKLVRPGLKSTASGRYQVKLDIWHACRDKLKLVGFGQDSQDAVAVQLLLECRALPLILAGRIEPAIAAASHIWVSLPGNTAGQPMHPLPLVLAQWNALYKLPTLQEAA